MGFENGPTLLVLAGVHGSEYTPIVATQRLANEVDPSKLRGALILVHVANLPTYFGRNIYTNPIDGKNLNRVFPGRSDGSLTERIADFLVQTVYPLADAVLDLHSGDANEQLRPSYTAYYGKAGTPAVIQQSRDMAFAFGLDLTVEFQWELDGQDPSKKAIWAGSAAVAKGIPSIDVEMTPGMGLYDPIAIEIAYKGVIHVMEHLQILPDIPRIRQNGVHCLVTERHFIEAPEAGSWVPMVVAGSFVTEGTLLGYTTDLFGRERTFEALAPSDGLLLIRFEAPPVVKGDTVAVVAGLNSTNADCGHYLQQKPGLIANVRCIGWQRIATVSWLSTFGIFLFFSWRSRRRIDHIQLPTKEEHTSSIEIT